MAIAETAENIRWFSTVIIPLMTPFGVAAIYILVASMNRKREALNTKMDKLLEKIEENEKNCRDDINAVAIQARAFQQDIYKYQESIASKYPPRAEFTEAMRDLRNDLRNDIRQVTTRGRGS